MSDRTGRIAKNTLMLYVQMFLGMLIGLYTSRVVLNELGVEDYGLYNVVGGVVAMFGWLNTSMSGTTGRFITVALGQDHMEQLKKVFGLSLTIHILLGVLIVLLAEPVGIWFLQHKMQIPEARMEAAVWVFHCSVATAFFYILNVPYNAMIVAHERMGIFAYFSLIDLFLRLGVVLALPYFAADKLKLYAVLLLGIQILMQFIYWQYCFRNFHASRVKPAWDKEKFKEMSSFAGWSLFGDFAAILFSQGINILLNMFFGPAINAARGIAVQVQGVTLRFIGSFQTALNPQLMKSHAAKDYVYMHKLLFASSKLSFFLFLLLATPVFFEAHALLVWWLKIVPEYTVTFLRIILLISLIDCLANPLIISAKATGKIRKYQSVLGTFLLLIVPVSYFLLTLDFPPYTVFVVHFVIACVGHGIRVVLITPMIDLDVNEYIRHVIFKVLIVFVLASILPAIFYWNLPEGELRFVVMGLSVLIGIPSVVWLFGINHNERFLVMEQLKKRCPNKF
ncbi:MATE family efflux transporter [Sphingobacterium chuzhouense]|uniref:Lipopolysaccharide biosynthesis protein n=1 Tax=Sphingobacterium chuzhouense TaxID=1742264 RepID=A0ABR7XTM3_9SPHI|nr:oligosaccharide flippase family protein [Sphingobacterium chuzhouense]MBD1422506.1 lipopolysaccharide biosynthesis protein [Sphingobacterium chuzhouense]